MDYRKLAEQMIAEVNSGEYSNGFGERISDTHYLPNSEGAKSVQLTEIEETGEYSVEFFDEEKVKENSGSYHSEYYSIDDFSVDKLAEFFESLDGEKEMEHSENENEIEM